MPKPSPTESPLLFEVDPKPLEESLTALGGIPLVVQAFRSLGLPGSVQQHVAVKERERGYDEATFVESFVILNAAGGECVDDFAHLRSDAGLAELTFPLSGAFPQETVLSTVCQLHDWADGTTLRALRPFG